MDTMQEAATRLFAPGRGVLAPDEHLDRIARILRRGEVDDETIHEHRSLYLQNPELAEAISGVVVEADALCADPIEGILLGVRAGTSTHTFPEWDSAILAERTDEMRTRLVNLRDRGARFVKWRCDADPLLDPEATGYVDTTYLAWCAAISQDARVLPVLDIAMPAQRAHSLAVGVAVTANALNSLHAELAARQVDPTALVVRMNFVRAGRDHPQQTTPEEAARRTLDVLADCLPSAAPGVMFMSTGLPLEAACAHLAAVEAEAASRHWTRPLTFAFGNALTAPAWRAWHDRDLVEARAALVSACRDASAALTPVVT